MEKELKKKRKTNQILKGQEQTIKSVCTFVKKKRKKLGGGVIARWGKTLIFRWQAGEAGKNHTPREVWGWGGWHWVEGG